MKKLIGTFLPAMTNGDRIRAMSDEELAGLFEDVECPDGLYGKNCPGDPCSCLECWVRYLQQPTEVQR